MGKTFVRGKENYGLAEKKNLDWLKNTRKKMIRMNFQQPPPPARLLEPPPLPFTRDLRVNEISCGYLL